MSLRRHTLVRARSAIAYQLHDERAQNLNRLRRNEVC
jgi:hypothetical protein